LNLVILRVIVQARYDLQLSLSNSRSVFRWEKKEHALARLEYCFKPMVGDWVLNPADEFFQSARFHSEFQPAGYFFVHAAVANEEQ